MEIILITPFIYALCAVLAYGLDLADSQRTFGCGIYARAKYESDKRDALLRALRGPFGLIQVLRMQVANRRFHGLMFRSPYRNGL